MGNQAGLRRFEKPFRILNPYGRSKQRSCHPGHPNRSTAPARKYGTIYAEGEKQAAPGSEFSIRAGYTRGHFRISTGNEVVAAEEVGLCVSGHGPMRQEIRCEARCRISRKSLFETATVGSATRLERIG
jgi:hypothetical protein